MDEEIDSHSRDKQACRSVHRGGDVARFDGGIAIFPNHLAIFPNHIEQDKGNGGGYRHQTGKHLPATWTSVMETEQKKTDDQTEQKQRSVFSIVLFTLSICADLA